MKFVYLILIFIACSAMAQDEPAGAPPVSPVPTAPCTTEKHRQFDFWVGEWDVTENGQPAGHNNVVLVHGDCALNENWTSAASAFSGASFNMYDRANDKWHQTWVDNSGTLLELDGGLVDGSMVLSGMRPGPDGVVTTHRISFTPNDDGSVRQHWESSADGETWSTLFDGHYVRVDKAE